MVGFRMFALKIYTVGRTRIGNREYRPLQLRSLLPFACLLLLNSCVIPSPGFESDAVVIDSSQSSQFAQRKRERELASTALDLLPLLLQNLCACSMLYDAHDVPAHHPTSSYTLILELIKFKVTNLTTSSPVQL